MTPIEVHCPFFNAPRKETWWLLLAETKNNAIIGMGKVESLQDKTEKDVVFVAKHLKVGDHVLKLHLMCDSYEGFDREETIHIKILKDVNKPPEPEEEKDDSGSEGENNSLAKKPSKSKEDSDDSDDSDEE